MIFGGRWKHNIIFILKQQRQTNVCLFYIDLVSSLSLLLIFIFMGHHSDEEY